MTILQGKIEEKSAIAPRTILLLPQEQYQPGDGINGELELIAKSDMRIQEVVVTLELVTKSKLRESVDQVDEVRLTNIDKLLEREPISLPFRFIVPLDRVNYEGVNLHNFWRIRVTLIPLYEVDKEYGSSFHNWGKDKSYGYTFSLKVVRENQLLGVKSEVLKVSRIDLGWSIGPIVLFLYLLVGIIAQFVTQSWSVFYTLLAVLAIIVLFIVGHLRWLSNFPLAPLEVSPGPDGSIRIRTLDRGGDQLANAIVGYSLVEKVFRIKGKSKPADSSVFTVRKPLQEVAHRSGSFLNIELPPPPKHLPESHYMESQGYQWELFLQNGTNLIGAPAEQRWVIVLA